MKRYLVVFLLVLFTLIPLSATSGSLVISLLEVGFDAIANHERVAIDIGEEKDVYLGGLTLGSLKKTFKNQDFMQLPFEQRSELYQNAKVPIASPVFKNLLIGWGSGSKKQGDLGGQVFGQIADWTAATTIGVGLGTLLIDFFFIKIFTGLADTPSNSIEDPLYDLSIGLMEIGAIFLVAERVFQAILPIPYGLRYNKTLRNGLGVNKDGTDMLPFEVALAPVMVLNSDQELGIQLVGRVSIAL